MILALLGSGCAASVAIERPFPPPLIEPLPLRVGVLYADSLANYVYHEEAATADRDWTVQLGPANVRLFDALFASLFRETKRVSTLEAAAQEVPPFDGVISPSVDAFEFSLPGQAATGQVGVWIRYNLDVYARDGQLIVRWPVTAYGQSGTDGASDEESMERAIVLAMRDAAATIAVDFARQPKVRESLLHETPTASP
ncbi:MAG: hypothetical protein IT486_07615 [Gammaproteobacteria bacterium]|nr:hypothetical protein [Gammaproteobacteria bacterium]